MTATATAHGMEGQWVSPDWPPLKLEELTELLSGYPRAGAARKVLTHSPRPFSAASTVLTEQGKIFVKRHHRSVRDAEGLREEHCFLAYLHARGADVPQVLARADGETAVQLGDWSYEVHAVPPGLDLYGEAISWTPFFSATHARSAGAALARLHRAAKGYNAPRRLARPLVSSFTIFSDDDPAAALREYLRAHPVLAADQETVRCAEQAPALLAPFHDELRPLLPKLAPLWTQNDLHASNLFWSDTSSEAQATAIIDFGLADRANAVFDLAQAIERNIVGWLDLTADESSFDRVPVCFDHLRALLAGYCAERPLTEIEAAALAPMTALCHAEFALTEADYYLGALGARHGAQLAYDGYLLGHARWFRSSAGLRLLEAIRRGAEAGREALP